MNNFSQMLQSWLTFYATIASASATLAGLLFVSLSVNRDRLDAHARMAARRTFANLLDVLVLALIFLIPHQQPFGLGIALIGFGLFRLFATVAEGIKIVRKRNSSMVGGTFFRQIGLHLISSSGLVALGIGIYRQNPTAMFWPVAIVVGLLGAASWNAWELLFKE